MKLKFWLLETLFAVMAATLWFIIGDGPMGWAPFILLCSATFTLVIAYGIVKEIVARIEKLENKDKG